MAHLKRSLLLVEDNQDDEELTLRAIRQSGVSCEVDVVRHGGHVIGRVMSPGYPMPSLILLDFHLPGLSGLEVLRELRRNPETKRLPIVILSGEGSNRELANCLDSGANSCVQKPMDMTVYMDHVGQIVRYWLTVDRHPNQAPED